MCRCSSTQSGHSNIKTESPLPVKFVASLESLGPRYRKRWIPSCVWLFTEIQRETIFLLIFGTLERFQKRQSWEYPVLGKDKRMLHTKSKILSLLPFCPENQNFPPGFPPRVWAAHWAKASTWRSRSGHRLHWEPWQPSCWLALT